MKRRAIAVILGALVCPVWVWATPTQASKTVASHHSVVTASAHTAASKTGHEGNMKAAAPPSHPTPSGHPQPKAATQPTSPIHSADPLSQTKPDVSTFSDKSVHPLDSPVSAITDGGRMVLYLFPLLALIVGVMALVRKLQLKGKSFTLTSALFSARKGNGYAGLWTKLQESFTNPLRQQSARNLRVLETLSLGNTTLHLVEVQDSLLLIGSAPAGVALLKEFDKTERSNFASDFQALIEADLPGVEIVDELDERLQEVSSRLARRAQRLRTVREVEADIE